MADDHTWLKSYFIRRLDVPLSFDEGLPAKPAYWGIVDASGLSKAGATDGPAYKDPRLPVEQRVSDLVSRTTLEEKVSQLGHAAAAIPRLGIPEYNWWNEGLHGVARAGTATVFPQAIGLSATFDAPLIHEVADTISTEFPPKYYSSVPSDGSAHW